MRKIMPLLTLLTFTPLSAVFAAPCAPGMVGCSFSPTYQATTPKIQRQQPSKTAPCSVVGAWKDSYGGDISINKQLIGIIKMPYCNSSHKFKVTLLGTTGFTFHADWTGGSECQGSTETMTYDSSNCNEATGTWVNDDGVSGDDVWNRLGLSIIFPQDQSNFSLSQSDLTATDTVSFQAHTGDTTSTVKWSTNLKYSTSKGKGSYSISDNKINTTGSDVETKTYTSIGGILTVKASAKIDGSAHNAGPNTIFITGVKIPSDSITNQLLSLYSGSTPRLLTGIAMKESTYRQFNNQLRYGYSGYWPLESYDGGSHIGLMMVPVSKTDAWDWTANTQDGAKLFNGKLAIALTLEKKIIKNHPGLRSLTGIERENMALVLYGPYANASLSKQYYVPQKTNDLWDWTVNSTGNSHGVGYANSVRSMMQ